MASTTTVQVRKDLLILPDIRTPVERAHEKKRIRRQMILNCLRTNAASSRADVTRHLGFNSQTVKTLISDLVREGLVLEEPEEADGRMGRPPTPCRLNKEAAMVAGLFLSKGEVGALGLDLEGEELLTGSSNVTDDVNSDTYAEEVLVFLRDFLTNRRSKLPPLAGIGIGVEDEHLLESKGRFELMQPLAGSWLDRVIEAIRGEFDLPVLTLSRRRLQALASFWFGEGKNYDSFAYVSFEEVPSVTLIEDGHLRLGAFGSAGLLGNISMNEFRWSQGAAGKSGADDPFQALLPALKRGEKQSKEYLGDLVGSLVKTVSLTAGLWNPEAVVIGGKWARWGFLFEKKFREELSATLSQDMIIQTEFPVCAAALGDDALGAATAVLHHIFYPLPIGLEKVL